jgi:diguanylate cyclase (GGDEF)-like protein/PAS domain S-box-containing protein
MTKRKTLSQILLTNMLLVATLACVSIGALWIGQEIHTFNARVTEQSKRLIDERKERMQKEVDAAVAYLDFVRSQVEERTRHVIRERTLEAHQIATHLYATWKGKKTRAELESLVRESLRPIRFLDGRGYYFATRLDGEEMLCATCAHLEGKNLLDLRDAQGAYVIRDMAALVRKDREGFYGYSWSKPETPGREHRKMAYVKYFAPFDWFIGTGEYLEDTEQDLQREALDWIRRIRYDSDAYLFAGRWDGTALSGPATGKNMLGVTDSNGVKIVQEMIGLARGSGGFVEYVMPKIDGQRPEPKISYARGLPAWQWYVGTGLYIDDIERMVAESRQLARTDLFWNIGKISAVLALLWLGAFWLAARLNVRTRAMLQEFSGFFDRSAKDQTQMPVDMLAIDEFRELAQGANGMIARRRAAEDALAEYRNHLEEVVEMRTAELEQERVNLEQRVQQRTNDLSRSKESLSEAQRIARIGNWELDIPTGRLVLSDELLRIVERSVANYDAFLTAIHPEDSQSVSEAYRQSLETRQPYGITYRLQMPDGRIKYVHEQCETRFDSEGKPVLSMGTVQDITERKAAQEKLQLAASVFEHTREGIMITDTQGTIVDVNEAFTRITGYGSADAIGQNARFLRSGRQDSGFYKAMWDALRVQGHWSGELWNRRSNGEVYAALLTISAIRDGQDTTQQYVGLFSDITVMKAHQSELEHIAHFDALTHLPNRVLLADRLHHAMAQAHRRQQQLAVAFLDLDGFKSINDRHGHEIGDQVLIALAKRMKEALREGDTIARMGGDEFVTVLTDLENAQASVPLLSRLVAAAALPVQVGELSLQVSASLGVTLYPQAHDIDADQLLRQADQAMYQAKLAGKNRYSMFDAAQDSSTRDHHETLQRIRLALERGEFELHYQPKVNMYSGEVIGAEALIRWQHPEKGLLAPASFLPVIEDHPLAVDVGEWVIDTAMHQMEVWQAAGLDLPVSVNIGARQLQQGNFVERLQAILAMHPQVNPANLELEVLETSALEDIEQVSQMIEDCAGIGVRFALDDFGTGYSSLTYLKRLRVAMLKIDQSFVRDMLDDPDDLAILQGIIGLAAAFKREVIAEGVETVAHGTALLQLGCVLAQGYGIARPMPADQMPAWAATWQPDVAWGGIHP